MTIDEALIQLRIGPGINEDVSEEYNEAVNMAIEALEEQPKTGHWIWCASSHKCSNCGGYVCFSHKKLLKYCPECGAKMEEVQK